VIAGIATCRNEADIIEASVLHLLDQGIDEVWLYDGMSTDGTRDILATLPVHVLDDTGLFHRQPLLTTELAHLAGAAGATWIVPWDIDEFWVATNGGTVKDTLLSLPADVGRVAADMYQHLNWEWREPAAKPLPKMAFRYNPAASVHNGNHDVDGIPGYRANGHLQIRELQYRGFEHFCRKIEERCQTLDPALGAGEGGHHTQYRGWTVEQLRPAWDEVVARATVHDPVPTKVNV
jgi:hypothetical protein